MRLTVATPLALIVETDDVASLRAEDQTGAFGVLPGHADFITALDVSVVTWRDGRGAEHHAAVRGGVLQVSGGREIAIASPEAIADDDLRRLQTRVLTTYREAAASETAARVDAQRLYLAAIRQILRFVRSEHRSAIPGGAGAGQIETRQP